MNAPAGARRSEPAFDRLCRALALLGAAILMLATLLTVASVCGRYFLGKPIAGDLEIVALAMAASISLFMPYCELKRGNVIIDVFTDGAPPPVRAALDAAGALLLALAAGVLAWRLAVGGLEMRQVGDESMVLRLPTWIGFVPAVPAFALTAAAGIVNASRHLAGAREAGR